MRERVLIAQSEDKDFAKRGALAGCSGGVLWRDALAGVLRRAALAGCSGGMIWRGSQQEARKRLARGQQEASKKPARGQEEAPNGGDPTKHRNH